MKPDKEDLKPKKPARCRSKMAFGDDFGDNSTTFHCERTKDHTDDHRESGSLYGNVYLVSWFKSK